VTRIANRVRSVTAEVERRSEDAAKPCCPRHA
jgi:hypothetical protein